MRLCDNLDRNRIRRNGRLPLRTAADKQAVSSDGNLLVDDKRKPRGVQQYHSPQCLGLLIRLAFARHFAPIFTYKMNAISIIPRMLLGNIPTCLEPRELRTHSTCFHSHRFFP